MKYFMSSNCNLLSQLKPDDPSQLNIWQNKLRSLGSESQSAAMEFLSNHRYEKENKYLTPSSKNKACFESSFKLFEEVPKENYASLQPSRIIDIIFTPSNSLHYYYDNVNQWQAKKRNHE